VLANAGFEATELGDIYPVLDAAAGARDKAITFTFGGMPQRLVWPSRLPPLSPS